MLDADHPKRCRESALDFLQACKVWLNGNTAAAWLQNLDPQNMLG